MLSLAKHTFVTIAIKVSTTEIIIGVQFGVSKIFNLGSHSASSMNMLVKAFKSTRYHPCGKLFTLNTLDNIMPLNHLILRPFV